jgi:hypothetical protein
MTQINKIKDETGATIIDTNETQRIIEDELKTHHLNILTHFGTVLCGPV